MAIGGNRAHVLAIDYGLHPVLTSMGPAHITPGWSVLDKDTEVRERGGVVVEAAARRQPSGPPISSPPRSADVWAWRHQRERSGLPEKTVATPSQAPPIPRIEMVASIM